MTEHGQQCLTERQRMFLVNPLDSDRVARRSDSGRSLSYLEAWDVKAHLTKCFGFTGWDSHIHNTEVMFERSYQRADFDKQDKTKKIGETPMVEVAIKTEMTLSVRCQHGVVIASWTEGAVGQANVQAHNATRGDSYDNAIKQAASDSLKRCAISLGDQFGLSLYNKGSMRPVVRRTLLDPDMLTEPTADQAEALANSLGVESPVQASGDSTNEGSHEQPAVDEPA